MRADSTLGQGVDAALVVVVFLIAGLALDSWLGTSPWLVLVMVFGGAAMGFWSMYRQLMGKGKRGADVVRLVRSLSRSF